MPIGIDEWKVGASGSDLVLNLLKDNKLAYSTNEIVRETGVVYSTAYKALNDHEETGKIASRKIRGALFWIHTDHISDDG